jgi:hypothetical protein
MKWIICKRRAFLGTATGARTFLSAASPERQCAPASSQANLPFVHRYGQECPRADQVAPYT